MCGVEVWLSLCFANSQVCVLEYVCVWLYLQKYTCLYVCRLWYSRSNPSPNPNQGKPLGRQAKDDPPCYAMSCRDSNYKVHSQDIPAVVSVDGQTQHWVCTSCQWLCKCWNNNKEKCLVGIGTKVSILGEHAFAFWVESKINSTVLNTVKQRRGGGRRDMRHNTARDERPLRCV